MCRLRQRDIGEREGIPENNQRLQGPLEVTVEVETQGLVQPGRESKGRQKRCEGTLGLSVYGYVVFHLLHRFYL